LDRAEVVTLSLSPKGSSGSAKIARAVAWDQEYLLGQLLANNRVVIVIAGVGGSVGSGMTPVVAQLSVSAGAKLLVAVVTPFDFEGRSVQRITNAIERLNRSAELVQIFSNQDLSEELGDEILLDHFFAVQAQRIAVGIRNFLNS
jgi:cell division GTPase FtsZ